MLARGAWTQNSKNKGRSRTGCAVRRDRIGSVWVGSAEEEEARGLGHRTFDLEGRKEGMWTKARQSRAARGLGHRTFDLEGRKEGMWTKARQSRAAMGMPGGFLILEPETRERERWIERRRNPTRRLGIKDREQQVKEAEVARARARARARGRRRTTGHPHGLV